MALSILDVHADKVSPEPNSGCWLWTGALSSHGYAHARFDGRMVGVHRVVLAEKLGHPVPRGLEASHLCGVRCCVNSDHLVAESRSANEARKPLDVRQRVARASGASRRAVAVGYVRTRFGRFQVRAMFNRRRLELGTYSSEALASSVFERFRAALASGVTDPAALRAAARGDAHV